MKLMRIVLTLLCLTLPLSAHAIKVKNLTDIPHEIELERNPGSIERETVQPGDTVFLTGRGHIRIAGNPPTVSEDAGIIEYLTTPSQRGYRANYRDYFIIWEKGELTHQMRRKGKGRK